MFDQTIEFAENIMQQSNTDNRFLQRNKRSIRSKSAIIGPIYRGRQWVTRFCETDILLALAIGTLRSAHCAAHRLTTLLNCKIFKYGDIICERKYMEGI